jgi:glycine cleavage system H lipoate-binding protein
MQFPEDRRYSVGHTWLQELDGRRKAYRFGLDGFAAALIGSPRIVRWNLDGEPVRPSETACTIEFDGGVLHLGIPVSARVSGHNQVLDVDPAALVNAPYGGGWIMDLVQVQKGDLEPLLTAAEAQKQARLDLRRFRRRIALHLLAESSGLGPTLADGGELVADPWCILGGPRYLELLRELIH